MRAETTTNLPETATATKAELRYGDVLLAALAIAGVVFGNIAIVRAMDFALDNFAR